MLMIRDRFALLVMIGGCEGRLTIADTTSFTGSNAHIAFCELVDTVFETVL